MCVCYWIFFSPDMFAFPGTSAMKICNYAHYEIRERKSSSLKTVLSDINYGTFNTKPMDSKMSIKVNVDPEDGKKWPRRLKQQNAN